MRELSRKLEAVLFIAGEPLGLEKLSKLVQKEKSEVKDALAELESALQGRGVRLSQKDDKYLLVTAPELGKFVEAYLKEELGEEMGRATLETLAVIVYKGPLARSELDYIRGVNSSFTVRNLMIRGLVERKPHPKDARVWLYSPSFEFLKFMGLEKLEKLPGYNEFRKEMEDLMKQNAGSNRA